MLVDSKGPGPGHVHDPVLNLSTIFPLQVDDLGEGLKVKYKPDLGLWGRTKDSFDKSKEGLTILCFLLP